MKHDYWDLVHAQPGAQLTEHLKRLEDFGITGVWGIQLHSPPFATLGAAAMATTRLKIGSGIALAFTRSPVETAMMALDLDRISDGRMVLGLGTSTRTVVEQIHGTTYGGPLAHLREVTEAVRAIIERGHTRELKTFRGKYYNADLAAFNFSTGRRPLRPSIPIWLSALFDKSIELAAQIGDGLMGHPMWSLQAMQRARAKLVPILAERGRARPDFHVNLWNYVAIANDRQAAINDMRGTVAFYASIKQYEKFFAAEGFGAEARRANAAGSRGDVTVMIKAVPDEMVTTFAIAGTPDDVRERVSQLWQHADSLSLMPPQTVAPGQGQLNYHAAIEEHLYKQP
jgi:probable F420-dependent oxidoreductase